VSGRVDEPRGVEADGDAEEGSPEDHANCAYNTCLQVRGSPRRPGKAVATGSSGIC
jgi:hypothetical protein